MDGFTASATAGNALQFAVFLTAVLKQTRSIYNSVDGTTVEQQDLVMITQDIIYCSMQLQRLTPAPLELISRPLEGSEYLRLHQRSREVGYEISTLLQSFKQPNKKSKSEALTMSVKMLWCKQKLERLMNQLHQLRLQVMYHVMTDMLFVCQSSSVIYIG